MTVDPDSGEIHWTPQTADLGVLYPVSLVLIDQHGNHDAQIFVLFGDTVNEPPYFISSPKTEISLDEQYVYAVSFSDPNVREEPVFSVLAGPAGLTTTQSAFNVY